MKPQFSAFQSTITGGKSDLFLYAESDAFTPYCGVYQARLYGMCVINSSKYFFHICSFYSSTIIFPYFSLSFNKSFRKLVLKTYSISIVIPPTFRIFLFCFEILYNYSLQFKISVILFTLFYFIS